MDKPNSELVSKTYTRYYSPLGDKTCRLSSKEQCVFLGVCHFGQQPVCMYGENRNLWGDNNGFIIPDSDCFLWKEGVK